MLRSRLLAPFPRVPVPRVPALRARAAGVLLGGLSLLALSEDAHAYCRTRTCEFEPDEPCPFDDVTGCSTRGEFVFWEAGCIPFAVQRDGSISDAIEAGEVEALIAEGFEAWSQVRCAGGGSPELSSASQGQIACDAVEYDCEQPEANSNLVMFRDDFRDMPRGLRFGVIALTTLTANLVSGELFDADIEINSRDEDFDLGEPSGAFGGVRDLRGVINHELGHLLGLSHSREPGALMRAGYEGTALPAGDDAEAMCAALGSSMSDPACEVSALSSDSACLGSNTRCTSQRGGDPGGCSCQVGAPVRPSLVGWGMAALALLIRYRRRGSRGASVL